MKKAILSFAFIAAASCAALEPDYVELTPQYMQGEHDVGRPVSNWTSNGYALAFTLGWDVGRRETMRTATLAHMARMERIAETDLATHGGGGGDTHVTVSGATDAEGEPVEEELTPERSLDLAIKALIGILAMILLGVAAKYKDRMFGGNGKAKKEEEVSE